MEDNFKEYKHNWYLKNKERILKKRKEYYLKNILSIREKRKIYRLKNKESKKNYDKEYRIKNKDKILNYRNKNKEKIQRTRKKWYLKNIDKIIQHSLKYFKNKFKTDISFKIKHNLRTRIISVLNGKSKSKRTLELLGCSVDFLKSYLESKFKEGMSWSNYGRGEIGKNTWQIDHIIPCAKFDLTDPKQQEQCFHYTNLQPLWWKENYKKGHK